MSLRDWIGNTTDRLRRDGARGLVESGHLLYSGSWRIVGSRLPIGTNVYDREWDALVVLDGCRVDLLEAVADRYPFIGDVDSLTSVASTSREWLAKTFAPDRAAEVANTAYVTANPYSEEILGADSIPTTRSPFNPANWPRAGASDFLTVEEVWADGWDDALGTVPPRPVTDRAIHAARERAPERLIVHYMQPHQPFIGAIDSPDEAPDWFAGNCWHALRRGEVSRDELWAAYRANLEFVLDDVGLLLENLDADTVVLSADHGNAMGEWGVYGHPNGCLQPTVKRVPWVRTTATDTGEYRPDGERETTEASVSDRLESLGYL